MPTNSNPYGRNGSDRQQPGAMTLGKRGRLGRGAVSLSLFVVGPILHYDANVLTQRDLVLWPVVDCCPIGGNRRGVIVQAGAGCLATLSPARHPRRRCERQSASDSTRPRPTDIYTPVASRQVSYGNQTS